MKRTQLRPKAPQPRPARQWKGEAPKQAPARATLQRADGKARMCVPVPKSQPVRDESYRRWVASLPCAHCGIDGYSQAAHGDEGKGMGIKSSDDTCYPACGPHLSPLGWLDAGCHWKIGTSGEIPRQERRELEARYGHETRALWAQKGKD